MRESNTNVTINPEGQKRHKATKQAYFKGLKIPSLQQIHLLAAQSVPLGPHPARRLLYIHPVTKLTCPYSHTAEPARLTKITAA
jgi:hypothetical protein